MFLYKVIFVVVLTLIVVVGGYEPIEVDEELVDEIFGPYSESGEEQVRVGCF